LRQFPLPTKEFPVASKKTAVAVAAGVLALGAGVGIAGVAAAAPTPTPNPTATGSAAPDSDRPGGRTGGFRDGAQVTELAGKLGVTEEQLTEALRAIREENRSTTPPTDQTREQRDAALAKSLAEKLNLDEAKVSQALAEIRAAKQAERAAALKERLDAAVADGTLTQAEADAVTKAVEQGVINVGGRGPR
jgi:transposase-like protein